MPANSGQSLKGKRIFILDDNPANLAIMKISLENAGAVCAFDRWGTQTIQKLQEFSPVDLILLDLMLPYGHSGYDVYEEMKLVPELAHVPTVIVTASDPGAELPKSQAKGFAGFISKPVRMHTLPVYLAKILAGESVWAPF